MLRVQTPVTPLLTLGGQNVKSVNHYQYLGTILNTELSDTTNIQRQLRHKYCAANKLRASFSRCSNVVENVLLCSFCTPMYARQLWCNFRKSRMQRLRVAYNFGCRALYNLSWRAIVSSHQVQCNIPTSEAFVRRNMLATCFSKDAESLATYGWVLWCSEIICIYPYSLTWHPHFTLWLSARTLQCHFDWWRVMQ